MGSKSDGSNWWRSCSTSLWDDGREPLTMLMTLWGFIKSGLWQEGDGDPPSGPYLMKSVGCGKYQFKDEFLRIELFIRDPCYVELYSVPRNAWFYNEYTYGSDPFYLISMTDTPFGPFQYGGGVFSPKYDGSWIPPEWDAADLVGVPKAEGYFAEELKTVLGSRKMRYSNHKDGTNCKVIME